jgi:4-alpha-glucanotransferase
MAFASSFYDVTRIDHFQAIAAYYAIPVDAHPREGHWEKGVGEAFVRRLTEEIGKNRFIVEDFGSYPGNSHDLARRYALPDMHVLQFTLSGGKTADCYPEQTVAYTGTHDNNTFLGFLDQCTPQKRAQAAALLGVSDPEDGKALVRAGICSLLASKAQRVVLPVQDLLAEGGESRMNVPGISGHGNWLYRMTTEKLHALEREAPVWCDLLKKYERWEKSL